MTQQLTNEWETKRTAESRLVEDLLRRTFPSTDAYRYNSASIRVRVVDERFRGKSVEDRDSMVEPLLAKLPEDIQADIVNLLTAYPDEANDSIRVLIANQEFEKPSPSIL
jgi:stress-induced morphogen